MNSTKNLIEPKLLMNPTKNLIEPKLYMIPTKTLIDPKLYIISGDYVKFRFYKVFSGIHVNLVSIRFLVGFM
jgi:hypothetical protein